MSEATYSEGEQAARAWLHGQAGDLPFEVGDARIEPVLNWGGFVNASFRVRVGGRRWHLKLVGGDEGAGLRTWAAVHDRLSERYRAPAMILSAGVPGSTAWGALFEHVPGSAMRGFTSGLLDDVLSMLAALHADLALADALVEAGAPGTPQTRCLDHYLENHDRRFRSDLESLPADVPFLDAADRDWMWAEVEALASRVRSAPSFQVITRAPVHGDLWADNLLATEDGSWHVVDWDDLRLGDPVVDYATVLGPAPHDLAGIGRPRLAPDLPLDAAARERMRTYARATLLDWVIDPLADWGEADAAGTEAPRFRAEKERIHREAKALYRGRWG